MNKANMISEICDFLTIPYLEQMHKMNLESLKLLWKIICMK